MENKPKKRSVKKIKILVVEDDRFYQEICRDVLEDEGYKVDTVFTGEEALAKLREESYPIAIVDLVLPGMDGLKVLSAAKQKSAATDVIVMTGYATVESAVKALKSGASDYLTKPINPDELKLSVKRCIELRSLFEENNELKSIVKLYQTVQLVSNTLEMDQLYPLSLDSVMQGSGAEAGVALFRETEGKGFKLISYRGVKEESAKKLASFLIKKYTEPMPKGMKTLSDISKQAGIADEVGTHAALLPMTCRGDRGGSFLCDGLIAVCKKEPFDESDLVNTRFISEQIGLSFENALNYRGAQEMVFVDDLTGLYNMRYLNVCLDNEIKRAKRFQKGLGLLFIDLDHFKNVNDTYGHLIGSKLLKEISNVLKKCIREIDIGIRYGGDEFIVILTDTDPKGVMKVAERIRKKIGETGFKMSENISVKVTCCVGVAVYPEDADNKVDLIHLADKAMYRGKETTRNCVYNASNL